MTDNIPGLSSLIASPDEIAATTLAALDFGASQAFACDFFGCLTGAFDD